MARQTRTFLLSDIEGSTRRWEQDDAAMAAALERHDAMLREAVVAHRGRWLKHTGDGALAAFDSAEAALTAAVAIQRAVAAADWEAVGGLQVRIALHTGEARERDGDFFGPALNRLARLLAAAHGGQVLMTLATEELVRDLLPAGTGLRDLGAHALADLWQPEHVFQVEMSGLPADFPPLRGTNTAIIALPEFRTSFVGRDRDVAALAESLDTHRLVTLTGVGGSGKTRLAIETAHHVAHRFPHGVFFVDLASVTNGEHVARQTARAIGLLSGAAGTGSSEPVRHQLLRAVRGQRMLLVLDNCEHLLDACAEHVEELLAASQELRVLATSREALALEGEQAWPVTSLALPRDREDDAASMRLLVDRVRELRPGFELRDHDREHFADICRRLDGLPLALELAAARLEHLSPADLARRLDDRFRLLTGGRRRTERQQTLRAAIDWSYDLLDEAERVVLRRMSVFAGWAPLAAIEAVAGEGLDLPIVDLVGRLVARSLVVADTASDATRYRLLETIRAYGEERLVEAGEAEETRDRHCDWYLAWIESFPWDLRLFSQSVGGTLEREYENLRLALEWTAATGRNDVVAALVVGLTALGVGSGYGDELDHWRDLATAGGLEPRLAAVLEVHRCWLDLARYEGDPRSFDAIRDRVKGAHERIGPDDPYRAFAWFVESVSYSTRPEDSESMEQAATRAAELAVAADAPVMRLAAMTFQAIARLYEDDPAGAAEILRAAMHLPGWAPEHDGYNFRHALAVTLHLLGENDEALAVAREIVEDSTVWWLPFGLLNAAVIVAAQGHVDEARRYIGRAVGHVERLRWQHPMALIDCSVALGAVVALEGRWEDAARLLAISGGNTSHPIVFALWKRYRDRVRDQLPRGVRRRCIEEGSVLDPGTAIREELARGPGTARGT